MPKSPLIIVTKTHTTADRIVFGMNWHTVLLKKAWVPSWTDRHSNKGVRMCYILVWIYSLKKMDPIIADEFTAEERS